MIALFTLFLLQRSPRPSGRSRETHFLRESCFTLRVFTFNIPWLVHLVGFDPLKNSIVLKNCLYQGCTCDEGRGDKLLQIFHQLRVNVLALKLHVDDLKSLKVLCPSTFSTRIKVVSRKGRARSERYDPLFKINIITWHCIVNKTKKHAQKFEYFWRNECHLVLKDGFWATTEKKRNLANYSRSKNLLDNV